MNKVVKEKMLMDTWTCSAFLLELNICRYFFFFAEMSHKGWNPQELVVGIVFREAAGTQITIKYKYRQMQLFPPEWVIYFAFRQQGIKLRKTNGALLCVWVPQGGTCWTGMWTLWWILADPHANSVCPLCLQVWDSQARAAQHPNCEHIEQFRLFS